MFHKVTLTLMLTILTLTSLGATDISGNVDGVLSPTNNPYNIIGDTTIPAGNTLTVLAGVQVIFTGNHRLTVNGCIEAIGTAQDSVRFSGNGWDSIQLEDTTETSIFTHSVITGANIGINSIYSSFSLTNSRIGNCTTNAISMLGDNELPTYITHSKIHDTASAGINLTSVYYVYITGSEITRCTSGTMTQGAIHYSMQSTLTPPADQFLPLIKNNHIHHNYKQGITTWDITNGDRIRLAFENNIVEYNMTGIYLMTSSGLIHNNTVRNNFITGDINSGAGIMISGAGNVDVQGNIVTGNFTGFFLVQNASPTLANGKNIIYNNIDGSGANWSFYLYGSNTNIDASGNYFHSSDPATIATTIFDHNDNPALGTVNFQPLVSGGMMIGNIELGQAPEPVYYQFTFDDGLGLNESIQLTIHRNNPEYQIVVPAGSYSVHMQVNDSNYTGFAGEVNIMGNAITPNIDFILSNSSSNCDNTITPKPAIAVNLYPNPFTGQTAKFEVKSETTADMSLDIFNIKGQKVATVFNGKASNQTINYNFGGKLPTGVYFYRLTSNGYATTKKMVIMR